MRIATIRLQPRGLHRDPTASPAAAERPPGSDVVLAALRRSEVQRKAKREREGSGGQLHRHSLEELGQHQKLDGSQQGDVSSEEHGSYTHRPPSAPGNYGGIRVPASSPLAASGGETPNRPTEEGSPQEQLL